MKPAALLLAGSLAANAALLGYVALRPAPGPAEYPEKDYTRPPGSRAAADSPRAPAASVAAPSPDAPPADTWKRLQSADLPVYVANLRAAGLPDRHLRMLVNAEINDRFRDREEAARPKRPARNYWEDHHNYYNDPTTLEQRLAQIDIRREKAALRVALLGETPPSADDANNPIAPEKRDLLRQINEDYGAMISQIQRESRGLTLASDEEKMRFLREEQTAELKSLLSPQELHEHELRNSSTSSTLRHELSAFGATEQEFRALHDLRKPFDEQYRNAPPDADQDYWKRRNEAQKALDEQISRQLGPDRYRDYVRAKDYEYRTLANLTTRLGLPQTSADQAYDLRYSVPADALKIVKNQDLTPEAKQESLKVIAEQTRRKLSEQLGAEAAEAYLKRHGHWVKSLDRGQVVEFREDGSQSHHSIAR